MLCIVEQDHFLASRQNYIREYFAISFTNDSIFKFFYELELLDTLDENFPNLNSDYLHIKSLSRPGYYEIKYLESEDKTGLVLVLAENENNFPELKSILDIKNITNEDDKSKTDKTSKEFFILFMKNLLLDDQKQIKVLKIRLEDYNFVIEKYKIFCFDGMLKNYDTSMRIFFDDKSYSCDRISYEPSCLYKENEIEADDLKGKSCKNEKSIKENEIKNNTEVVEKRELLEGMENNKEVKGGQLTDENSLGKNYSNDFSNDKDEKYLNQESDKKYKGDDEKIEKSDEKEIVKNDEENNSESFTEDIATKKQEMIDLNLLKKKQSEILEETKINEKIKEKSYKIIEDNLNVFHEEPQNIICPEKSEEKDNEENIERLKNIKDREKYPQEIKSNPPIETEEQKIKKIITENNEVNLKNQLETINPNPITPPSPTESETKTSISGNQDSKLSDTHLLYNQEPSHPILNTNEENLIKNIENKKTKISAKDLLNNKFESTFIFSGPIEDILQEVDIVLIIIGHESSGRSSFIQTLLNYLEDRNETSLVIEKNIRRYEDKSIYYKYGNYSQTTNEILIVNTQKFDGKKILLVETPHFSEMFNPGFSEEKAIEEIRKLFVANKHQYHIILTKKGDESFMNSNMERCLKSILRKFPNCELYYVYTFYASSIVFHPSFGSGRTTTLKLNNNIYLRKQIRTDQWLKLQRKVDKFLKTVIENDSKKKDFNNHIMMKIVDNPFSKFPRVQDKNEKISIKRLLEIIMESNSFVYVKNKLYKNFKD